MANDSLKLQVLTPKGLEIEDHVKTVTFPSENGYIGILPGHCKYSGLVGNGILTVEISADGSTQKMELSGGFASVAANVVTILADKAVFLD